MSLIVKLVVLLSSFVHPSFSGYYRGHYFDPHSRFTYDPYRYYRPSSSTFSTQTQTTSTTPSYTYTTHTPYYQYSKYNNYPSSTYAYTYPTRSYYSSYVYPTTAYSSYYPAYTTAYPDSSNVYSHYLSYKYPSGAETTKRTTRNREYTTIENSIDVTPLVAPATVDEVAAANPPRFLGRGAVELNNGKVIITCTLVAPGFTISSVS